MKKSAAPLPPFRPPAVPLVTHDPYFSTWAFSETLNAEWFHHWTGAGRGICGLLRVDGRAWTFLGLNPVPGTPAMEQRSLEVTPTRTIAVFAAGGVKLTVTFCSPLLPHDLELLSRPVTYVTLAVRAADGKAHAVQAFLGVTGEWATDQCEEAVTWARFQLPGLTVMSVGAANQQVLNRAGDNHRANWGQFYLAAPTAADVSSVMGLSAGIRGAFAATGALPAADSLDLPRPVTDGWPGLNLAFDLGRVGKTAVSRFAMLAYDDLFALEYLHRRVRAWWRRDGQDAAGLLITAAADYARVTEACTAFDAELMADLRAVGGEKYARLCALAFRQCIAAHKLAADFDGSPLFMSKENFSNGCINTVDVTYPSAPFFLLLNPVLLKAQITPILDYARSPRWKFPFAPHDLGIYPLANGQVYGGGERDEHDQMPVEECGNLLILVAAYVEATGDLAYVKKYGNTLELWARYLADKGLDPESQLCTDDFAGHLAHNANLALKAIVAIACFAQIAGALGRPAVAKRYRQLAETMAADWMRMAGDGDHYRLVFDQPGSWSQKYNLVWDKLLGLNLFPSTVAAQEIAWYKQVQNRYGLPLDSRCAYTKLDWCVWSATLAERDADFRALVDPLYDWAHETPDRVPLADWYWTTDGKHVCFRARSVVGGLYTKLLADAKLVKKWRRRANPH